MADYHSKTLSNYFTVNDTIRLEEIISSCVAETKVEMSSMLLDGIRKYCFGCMGNLYGLPCEEDPDAEEGKGLLYEELQKILSPGDAIIIREVGNEALHYLVSDAVLITKDDIAYLSLSSMALEKVRIMLGKPDFTTKMEY